MLYNINKRIPQPSDDTIVKLLRHVAGEPLAYALGEPPEWLRDAIIIAYQSGRYDEACAETVAGVL